VIKGTANETGTGFGLILCKEFIVKNGGEIRVTSTQGKGSTFSFTLPYVA
jgi:signal transduction histidine kinase